MCDIVVGEGSVYPGGRWVGEPIDKQEAGGGHSRVDLTRLREGHNLSFEKENQKIRRAFGFSLSTSTVRLVAWV